MYLRAFKRALNPQASLSLAASRTHQTALGSSSNYSATAAFDSFDILSSDSARNPDFYDWTGVYIKYAPRPVPLAFACDAWWHRYCDSSSYSGMVEQAVQWQGNSMYFRGFANLDAVRRVHTHHLRLRSALPPAFHIPPPSPFPLQIVTALLCQSQPLPPSSPCLSAASDLILTGSSAGDIPPLLLHALQQQQQPAVHALRAHGKPRA